MNEKIVWMNAYSTPKDYLSGSYRSREDADMMNARMQNDYGKEEWQRSACLKLRLYWEDGQGLEEPLIEVHAEGGEA